MRPLPPGRWPCWRGAGAKPDWSCPAFLSWRSNPLWRRSSRCQHHAPRPRPNFGARGLILSAQAETLTTWPRNSSPQGGQSAHGSARPNLTTPPSRRALEDASLKKKIHEVHQAPRKTYGAPRFHAELREQGGAVGQKRVARLMRAEGWRGRTAGASKGGPWPAIWKLI
ncbi:MAG: IS3 family transposase [Desulfovibrio sp.]|nr:IS3 family transposase [Desulfovibrio sp.]